MNYKPGSRWGVCRSQAPSQLGGPAVLNKGKIPIEEREKKEDEYKALVDEIQRREKAE